MESVTQSTRHPAPAPTRPERFSRQHSLDSLSRLRSAELRTIYADGSMPGSLVELDGHPRGRMLDVVFARGPLRRGLRSFSGAVAFPWGGKSFSSVSAEAGRGINRVRLGGRHTLFPFNTSIASSLIDGESCVRLDYDLPDNPGVIRKIHDEVREVSPGLFLGPAMWKLAGPASTGVGFDARLVLWFALDTNIQAQPVGAS